MPPVNTPGAQSTPAPMVAIGSPEFNRAVAEAMALEKARDVPPAPVVEKVAVVQTPVTIQRTSIDTTTAGPDDLTIRFLRFCTMANCGYQRGQEAGFSRDLAMRAVASGSAILVHDPRIHDERFRRRAA